MSIGVSDVYVEDPQGSATHMSRWVMDFAGISHLPHTVRWDERLYVMPMGLKRLYIMPSSIVMAVCYAD